jgi:flagellar basal-body rod modification protein FlgD
MVSAISSSAATTSTTSAASSVLASDFDTFLQLLTTQLQNQDPTSPMDANAFTEQLVQFSQVEQQINMNKNLESMLAMMQSQQASTNLGYVGKVVDVDSNQSQLTADSSAYWAYDLPDGAATVQYTIRDENGDVVYSDSIAAGDDGFDAGRIELAWDGTDTNGIEQEPGTYTLEITAKDSQGNVMDDVNVYSRGYVEALETIDGQQYLLVSGIHVLAEDVVSVYADGGSDA